MSEIERQIHQVEASVEEAKELIAKSDALARLEKNKDFKFLVMDGLLEKDAVRSVMLLASPGLARDEDRTQVQNRIDMIGNLYNYFHYVHQQGNDAREGLAEYENTQEELLAEQLGAEVM
jgi:hypothetical protein